MARPHVEFIQAFDLPEAAAPAPWHGARRRVLSNDDADGSASWLLSVPGGWSADLAGLSRPVELFTLRGRLVVGGQQLVEGCYAWVPSGAADRTLRTTEQTLLVVFVEAERQVAGEVEVVDTGELPWEELGVEAGTPRGIVRKLIRRDPVTGDDTYLVSCVAYWRDRLAERHPTVQEGILIRGDCLDGLCGGMRPGDYFWRPSMVPHGPIFTHSGALFLFRTKGGSWEVTYEEVPEWRDLVERYQAREPYFTGPAW